MQYSLGAKICGIDLKYSSKPEKGKMYGIITVRARLYRVYRI